MVSFAFCNRLCNSRRNVRRGKADLPAQDTTLRHQNDIVTAFVSPIDVPLRKATPSFLTRLLEKSGVLPSLFVSHPPLLGALCSPKSPPADPHALNQYGHYLRILASQQIALRFQGKVDLSGVVQETLWEAHQELEDGSHVAAGQRLPWLRRILSNNLADAVRRMAADKRNVSREVSLQRAIEQSSMRLEAWLACEVPPDREIVQEERVLQLVGAWPSCPMHSGKR